MRLNLADAVAAVSGELLPAASATEREIVSVVSDSRRVDRGSLFICLPGERVDGHDFARKAAAEGAVAVLGERDPFAPGPRPVPVIVVRDAVVALGNLASFWRGRTAARVTGITGTAGKTTVKEILAQILSSVGSTSRNRLNFNNQIGLPLSILGASEEDMFWVMEAGISNPGDMDELGSVLRPDVALAINAGPGHAAGLGEKGVAHYKARLFSYLPPTGIGIVSADYPDLVREARSVRSDLVFFSSMGRQVDYRAAYVAPSGEHKGVYRLWLNGETADVEAPFRGAFGAENVIAVATAAHCLGVPTAQIAEEVSRVTLPEQRFCCKHAGDWLVVDDSYNANPLSAARMLEAVSEMAAGRPLVCVLGEMLELGAVAEQEHETLGRRVAGAKARAVFWKGGQGEAVLSGLKQAGFNGLFQSVTEFSSVAEGLKDCGLTGGVILFKGSRRNHLEEMAGAFLAREEQRRAV